MLYSSITETQTQITETQTQITVWHQSISTTAECFLVVIAGIALRVPTPNVSVVDLVIQTEKKTFAEEVNEAFREYSRGKGAVSILLCQHL